MILPENTEGIYEEELPLLIDVAMEEDMAHVRRTAGHPQWVEGKEALKNWIWKALHTKKDAFAAYSDQFGYEMYDDVGMIRVDGEKIEQAVREALCISPYIEDVTDFSCERDGSAMRLEFTVETVYGNVEVTEEVYGDDI